MKQRHCRRRLLRGSTTTAAAALMIAVGIGISSTNVARASSSSPSNHSPSAVATSGLDVPLGTTESNCQYAINRVRDFLHYRSSSSSSSSSKSDSTSRNSEPAVCWVYTGSLMDPLTGQRIANVEGLELVQLLATTAVSGSSEEKSAALTRFRRRCGDLQIAKALVQDPSLSSFNQSIFCGTILSRKLFCYTEATAHQRTSNAAHDDSLKTEHPSSVPSSRLLHQLRKRPGGPVTRIPVDQSVTVYDTAVSVLVPTTAAASSSTTDSNNNWLMHTEWPNGRSIWSMARLREPDSLNVETPPTTKADTTTQPRFWRFRPRRTTEDSLRPSSSNEHYPVEFTVYSRPKSQTKKLQADDVQKLLLRQTNSNDSEPSVSPRRAAWIQFGSTLEQQQSSKYGARESYSLFQRHQQQHRRRDRVWVRYTRYGEAPVWYGPGRMCQLELTGHKLPLLDDDDNNNNNDQLRRYVPTAVETIQQYVPNFWKFGIASSLTLPNQRKRSTRGNDHTNSAEDSVATINEKSSHDDDDAAVGRWVNRHFREEHPLSLMDPHNDGDSPFDPVWQALNRMHERGRKVIGIVRAATSISIGGG